MKSAILGISSFYHDSAAALLVDGKIAAAAQEERFTRIKHDPAFPLNAVRYVLEEAGLEFKDLSAIAFYEKPYMKFERLLETYHAFAPRGLVSWLEAIPVWIKEKLFMKKLLRDELAKVGEGHPPLYFPEHHLSHAASAFYPSPFEDAAILTIDGVGEWATTTIGHGQGNSIKMQREIDFPHSLGLLYSAFTYYTGFRVNSGEYKLMGLAPYGNSGSGQVEEIKSKITGTLVHVREDGSTVLNMDYFDFATGLKMVNEKKWEELFGIPARGSESAISQDYMNMALAIQQVTEDVVLRLARTAKQLTGSRHLVMAGGVALNSVANGRILQAGLFDDIWIQPAAGDAGGALGAAYAIWHIQQGQPRTVEKSKDSMRGAYLGPEITDKETARVISKRGAKAAYYENFEDLAREVAAKMSEGNVIGWVQGRMEFGPRALGNRSIIGDARNPEMQKKMNLKIKYREGFRPFAPSVLAEDSKDYFQLDGSSPYMLLVVPVRNERRIPVPENYNDRELYERLYFLRSDLPAITHVDYSARVQSVEQEVNPRYWKLIQEFKGQTGYGVIVNTSFNVRGEPIVCTAEDAYRCFMRTEMDYLAVGNYLFDKREQPALPDSGDWKSEFKLD